MAPWRPSLIRIAPRRSLPTVPVCRSSAVLAVLPPGGLSRPRGAPDGQLALTIRPSFVALQPSLLVGHDAPLVPATQRCARLAAHVSAINPRVPFRHVCGTIVSASVSAKYFRQSTLSSRCHSRWPNWGVVALKFMWAARVASWITNHLVLQAIMATLDSAPRTARLIPKSNSGRRELSLLHTHLELTFTVSERPRE